MEGVAVDMNEFGIWEPLVAKSQTIKTAVESGKETNHSNYNQINQTNSNLHKQCKTMKNNKPTKKLMNITHNHHVTQSNEHQT